MDRNSGLSSDVDMTCSEGDGSEFVPSSRESSSSDSDSDMSEQFVITSGKKSRNIASRPEPYQTSEHPDTSENVGHASATGTAHSPSLLQSAAGPDLIQDAIHPIPIQSDSEDEDIDPEEKVFEKQNKNIFVRRIMKSATGKSGRKKKHDRILNLKHPCPFCNKSFCHFAQHVLGNSHSEEKEVMDILKLDVSKENEKKKRKAKIQLLRLRGENQNNMKVMSKGSGEIILGRRLDGDWEFNINKFGPCPSCKGWLKLCSMWRHQSRCVGRESGSQMRTTGELTTESAVLSGRLSDQASDALKKEVFTIMTNDSPGRVAKGDSLIISLGNMWMQRNVGNKLMRRYYTSSIMRLMAKLLIHLRNIHKAEDTPLWDFIKPQYYQSVVEAALLCCAPDESDTEDLSSPSNALKLGFDLKRISSMKHAESIMQKDGESKKDSKEFLFLMNSSWGHKVTKLARTLLDERQFNKKIQLPPPGIKVIKINNISLDSLMKILV